MNKEKKPLTDRGYIKAIAMMVIAIVFLTTASILLINYGRDNNKFFLIVGIIGLVITTFYLIVGILNVKNFFKNNNKK